MHMLDSYLDPIESLIQDNQLTTVYEGYQESRLNKNVLMIQNTPKLSSSSTWSSLNHRGNKYDIWLFKKRKEKYFTQFNDSLLRCYEQQKRNGN